MLGVKRAAQWGQRPTSAGAVRPHLQQAIEGTSTGASGGSLGDDPEASKFTARASSQDISGGAASGPSAASFFSFSEAIAACTALNRPAMISSLTIHPRANVVGSRAP